MADWRSIQINVEPLENGKFYNLVVDKNSTTVLFKTMTIKKFMFNNIKYFEVPEEYDGFSSFKIWEKIETNASERYQDITMGCKVNLFKRDEKWYMSFEVNKPITGFIQFN